MLLLISQITYAEPEGEKIDNTVEQENENTEDIQFDSVEETSDFTEIYEEREEEEEENSESEIKEDDENSEIESTGQIEETSNEESSEDLTVEEETSTDETSESKSTEEERLEEETVEETTEEETTEKETEEALEDKTIIRNEIVLIGNGRNPDLAGKLNEVSGIPVCAVNYGLSLSEYESLFEAIYSTEGNTEDVIRDYPSYAGYIDGMMDIFWDSEENCPVKYQYVVIQVDAAGYQQDALAALIHNLDEYAGSEDNILILDAVITAQCYIDYDAISFAHDQEIADEAIAGLSGNIAYSGKAAANWLYYKGEQYLKINEGNGNDIISADTMRQTTLGTYLEVAGIYRKLFGSLLTKAQIDSSSFAGIITSAIKNEANGIIKGIEQGISCYNDMQTWVTIKYETYGGTSTFEDQTFYLNRPDQKLLGKISKDGYTMCGWSVFSQKSEKYAKKYSTNQEVSNDFIEKYAGQEKILYAYWQGYEAEYLFIGNSMIFVNNVAEMFNQLNIANNNPITYKAATYPGRTLYTHYKAIQAVIKTKGDASKLTAEQKKLFTFYATDSGANGITTNYGFDSSIYERYAEVFWDYAAGRPKQYQNVILQLYYKYGTGDASEKIAGTAAAGIVKLMATKLKANYVINATWSKWFDASGFSKFEADQHIIDNIAYGATCYITADPDAAKYVNSVNVAYTGRAICNYYTLYGTAYAQKIEPEAFNVYRTTASADEDNIDEIINNSTRVVNDLINNDHIHTTQLGSLIEAISLYYAFYGCPANTSYNGIVTKRLLELNGSKGKLYTSRGLTETEVLNAIYNSVYQTYILAYHACPDNYVKINYRLNGDSNEHVNKSFTNGNNIYYLTTNEKGYVYYAKNDKSLTKVSKYTTKIENDSFVTNLVNVSTLFSRKGYHVSSSKAWKVGSSTSKIYLSQASGQHIDLSQYAQNGNDGQVTLFPNWIANSYTIKFNANGGKGSMPSLNAKYDSSVKLPAVAFTKEGCVFLGWNTKADGSGKFYSDSKIVKNLTSVNGATVTLYAQWAAIVTVKFDGNGATKNTFADQTFMTGVEGQKFVGSISRTGYTFVRWGHTKKAEVGYEKNNSVPDAFIETNAGKTVTLYAIWKKQ